MTYDEMIEIIQAAKEGKQLEYKYNHIKSEDWESCTKPRFNFHDYNYRIKPEQKYRPWKFEEIPVGKIIYYKMNDTTFCKYLIISCGKSEDGKIINIAVSGYNHSVEEVFQKYTMEDGTPCGTKE